MHSALRDILTEIDQINARLRILKDDVLKLFGEFSDENETNHSDEEELSHDNFKESSCEREQLVSDSDTTGSQNEESERLGNERSEGIIQSQSDKSVESNESVESSHESDHRSHSSFNDYGENQHDPDYDQHDDHYASFSSGSD